MAEPIKISHSFVLRQVDIICWFNLFAGGIFLNFLFVVYAELTVGYLLRVMILKNSKYFLFLIEWMI